MILLLALALAAVPTPTPAEAATLAEGGVVLRDVPPSFGGVAVLGLADVQADEDAVWAAMLDFPARLGANPALRAVSAYRPPTATEQWWRWEVARFGVTVVYHNRYEVDRGRGTLLHELDPAMPNDLRASRGWFELAPIPGGFRMAYTAETDLGRSVPGFVAEWLAGAGVRSFLEGVVSRAEAG